MNERQVPLVVIKRLPRYHRYLGELLNNNVTRISSTELSEKMGVTASQIRQDLNFFGGFGQQGYGYNVKLLHERITSILGLDKGYKTIIIGAGNLGRALANYGGFANRGFNLGAVFDTDSSKIGGEIAGLYVKPYSHLKEYVLTEKPDIAILAVPKMVVAGVADDLVDFGVKAIWNFANVDLSLPSDVIVENVHLSESLMTLSYKIADKGN